MDSCCGNPPRFFAAAPVVRSHPGSPWHVVTVTATGLSRCGGPGAISDTIRRGGVVTVMSESRPRPTHTNYGARGVGCLMNKNFKYLIKKPRMELHQRARTSLIPPIQHILFASLIIFYLLSGYHVDAYISFAFSSRAIGSVNTKIPTASFLTSTSWKRGPFLKHKLSVSTIVCSIALDSLKISELRERLAKFGCSPPSKTKKAELITMLAPYLKKKTTKSAAKLSTDSDKISSTNVDLLSNPAFLHKLTVPQLKNELKSRNLQISGPKADLIDRLEHFLNKKDADEQDESGNSRHNHEQHSHQFLNFEIHQASFFTPNMHQGQLSPRLQIYKTMQIN
jgi:hypothetical protein